MKSFYQDVSIKKIIFKRITIAFFTVILGCSSNNLQAQVIKRPFTARTSNKTPEAYEGIKNYRLQGDFVLIGNTNLVSQNNSKNNKQVAMFSGSVGTFNESDAEFRFPPEIDANCTEIIYAGLYWSGRAANIILDSNKNEYVIEWFRRLARSTRPRQVQTDGSARLGGDGLLPKEVIFKTPKKTSRLTASEIYFDYAGADGLYTAYYDVTDLVSQSKAGKYTVADIASNAGTDLTSLKHGLSAGWGMVIIYKNITLEMRDITVYDGFGFIKPALNKEEEASINISGFKPVKSGEVKVKVGVMAVEGDLDEKGDYFQMKYAASNSFENLKHRNNSTDNFFNSSIITGNNERNPNITNNFGTDIAVFEIDNLSNKFIKNDQNNTVFKFGSTSDVFALYNIVLSVNADLPENYIQPKFTTLLNPITQICENVNAVLTADANVNNVKWEYFNSGEWKELRSIDFTNLIPSNSTLTILKSSENLNRLKIRAKIPNGSCWLYDETEIRVEKVVIKQPENLTVMEGKSGSIKIQTDGRPVIWEYLEKHTGLWKTIAASDFKNHLIPSGFELKVEKADKNLKNLKVRAVINKSNCHIESTVAIIKINTPMMIISNPNLPVKTIKNN